jgi:peptidoglycan/xylan/chitin deacetylase (PgdA/CDA1 family)
VVAIDCGMKRNIVRMLNQYKCNVTVVPYNTDSEVILSLLPDGCLVNLMRPPGGASGSQVSTIAKEMNLSIIAWSVDPKDWATNDTDLIFSRLLAQTGDGDVILLHDMSVSSVDAALALVDELQAQGYQFLTVSQLAMLRLRQLRPGQSYEAFRPDL